MVGSSNCKKSHWVQAKSQNGRKIIRDGGGGGGILPKNSVFDSIICPHSVKVIDSLESLIF